MSETVYVVEPRAGVEEAPEEGLAVYSSLTVARNMVKSGIGTLAADDPEMKWEWEESNTTNAFYIIVYNKFSPQFDNGRDCIFSYEILPHEVIGS